MDSNEFVPQGELPAELTIQSQTAGPDMNCIVGTSDILFLCYDTLRYDAAKNAEAKGTTPVINRYGSWEKRHAAGNFTYPSHHAMFAGFLPVPWDCKSMMEARPLFFPKDIGLGRKAPEGSFAFEGATFVEGLAKAGYETICIGGVSFFNKRTELGRVFPSMFQKSYWKPAFGCSCKDSAQNQFQWAMQLLERHDSSRRMFLYINISAIHYPNYFYLEGAPSDCLETHEAALAYVDRQLEPLLEAFRRRGSTFVIACSDHGSCYGEKGKQFHGLNNDTVNTVPYMEFLL